MRASWKTIFSSRAEPVFGGRPLEIVRHATARAMRLRVDPRDGRVRLTLPRRASLRAGLAWAETQRGWVDAQLARVCARERIVDGLELTVGGAPVRIVAEAGRRSIALAGDVLRVPADPDLLEARVLRWLKAEARRVLDAETRAVAARAGVTVGRVSVGDARSRWGSCSSNGDIRYSWRLILAPEAVRRSTVAHEVAHRVHMNHGPAFKRLETELLGEPPGEARAWLRAHGAGLFRYG